MQSNNKFLVVIVGPTAVGKTSVAISIAKTLQTEVVSADSRQFFKEMNIGTAKPNEAEMAQVKHHFVDTLSIDQYYSAGLFEEDVLKFLTIFYEDHDTIVMTGGSGLYVQAVLESMDEFPDADLIIRNQLYEELELKGMDPLIQELRYSDPVYYEQVDLKNKQRVIRALEVCRATGKPFSSYRRDKAIERPFIPILIGLEREREELFERINERMDLMIRDGLFEEAKKLYPHKDHNALQTVGYKEIFDFMEGQYDKEEAVRLLKRNSRRYAKRQLTWFKRNKNTQWFHPDQLAEMLIYIQEFKQQYDQ